jgi:hypothetical protein
VSADQFQGSRRENVQFPWCYLTDSSQNCAIAVDISLIFEPQKEMEIGLAVYDVRLTTTFTISSKDELRVWLRALEPFGLKQ